MKPAKLLKLLYVQVLIGLVLGIAVGHWWPEFGAALKPAVDRGETDSQPFVPVSDTSPRRGVRQRIAFEGQCRAGHQKAPLVGKMRIKRMALNACPFSHHAESRERGADGAMQIDGCFDDALPRFRLLLSPALEGIGPCHHFHCTSMCNHY